MSSFKNLPQVNFAEKSVQEIETAIITTYEAISGRTLAPGDPVRLFLEAVAAIIAQQRVLIDYAAKMNLLAYSAGSYLDHIGALVGTSRLAATKALTTIRFALSAAQPGAVTIPAGTRVTPGGNVFFATTIAATIPANQLTVDVQAECTTAGTIGNGYQPGQINKLVDPLPWIQSVTNITPSEGGTDTETDDAYRERIRQAPESFSVAGPAGAYEYWARTAHQSIVDVAVYSPSAGQVEIRPLLAGGAVPDAEVLQAVHDVCSDNAVRPLTDQVSVLAPEVVSYDILLTYFIRKQDAAVALSIQQAVTKAVDDFVMWQKSKLGRDINPSELTARIMAAGAKRVQITSPAFTDVAAHQVAVANQVTVTYGGLEDG